MLNIFIFGDHFFELSRKYYAVTERGMDYLAAISGEWESLLEAINEIKEGTQHG